MMLEAVSVEAGVDHRSNSPISRVGSGLWSKTYATGIWTEPTP